MTRRLDDNQKNGAVHGQTGTVFLRGGGEGTGTPALTWSL